MLTKKQRWRRVRVVRVNSNSSLSSNDSTSDGGGGGGGIDACAGRDGFDCFPALASSSDSSSKDGSPLISSASGSNSNGGESPPQCRHALGSMTTDPARREGSSDSTTLRPPPPVPSPRQEATPLDANSSPVSNHAAEEAQAARPPSTFFPGGGGAQEQHGGDMFAPEAVAPARSHPLEAWRVSALNLIKFLFSFDANGIEDGHTRRHAGGFGDWGSDGGGGGGNRDRSATEGCHPFAAAPAAARPRRPSEPACRPPPPLPVPKAVRFSNQIRVILVASRLELSSMKTDIWWGESDYCDFRRAYFKAAREEKESDREVTTPQSRAGQGTPGEDESDGPGSSTVATSPTTATSADYPSRRTGTAAARDDDDDDPLSKPSCGSEDGGYDSDYDGDGGCSRASQQAVLPRPPPPSPEHQTREPPHAELDDAGARVGVKRLSGLLEDQRVAAAGEWEREKDGDGMTPPDVDDQAGASAAIPSNAVETAVVAEPTGTAHADVVNPQQGKQAASSERRESPVLGKAAVVTPEGVGGVDPAPDVAPVARGEGIEPVRRAPDVAFGRGVPWQGAGSREDAAMRSPGSSAVGPARAEALASPRAAAEMRREMRRETPMPILETGRDPRIDPQTGARMPLPFLGSAPIRRVASF